jgi:hypothetical protein
VPSGRPEGGFLAISTSVRFARAREFLRECPSTVTANSNCAERWTGACSSKPGARRHARNYAKAVARRGLVTTPRIGPQQAPGWRQARRSLLAQSASWTCPGAAIGQQTRAEPRFAETRGRTSDPRVETGAVMDCVGTRPIPRWREDRPRRRVKFPACAG